jgi:hypothetical protein
MYVTQEEYLNSIMKRAYRREPTDLIYTYSTTRKKD